MRRLFVKQIKLGISLFTVLAVNSSFAFANFENVDCTNDQKTLGISTVECQVLEKLWTTTKGKEWIENKNWDSLTKVDTWEGIVVDKSKVSSILLYSNNLQGTVPEELGKLSALKKLSFYNNALKGEVPKSFGELSELAYLDLGDNTLSGSIPQSLGSLSNLTELYLNNNQFTGAIPDTLGNLEALKVLKMYENNLTGSIPTTFGGLFNLEILSLAENHLSGEIPAELGALPKLNYVNLKSNKLAGSIPDRLGNLESLTGLYLQKNNLTGDIPAALGSLSNLTDLDLSDNQLSGTLPHSFGNLSVLTYLNVGHNQLHGDLPAELLNLTRMNYLNLEENNFVYGDIESLYKDLLEIPAFIISPELRAKKEENSSSRENVSSTSLLKQIKPITITIINEDERAMLELATLKIVGTEEAGDSLFVKNEGKWSIEDNKIEFRPIDGFSDAPSSIFYTIENNDGIVSIPIKISVKVNRTESLKINILENKSTNLENTLVEILLPEDFLEEHPGSILSEDKKELVVDSEGTWSVENNSNVIFTPEEDFTSAPSDIEYRIFTNDGKKSTVGMIEIKEKSSREKNSSQTNSVALFGVKGLFLMILFGGLFGMFYLKDIKNKKV